jgi:uncharacterized membrane protein
MNKTDSGERVMSINELIKTADVKRLTIVSALLIWCAFLIAVRVDRTGSGYYRFLLDNLFLACVPLILSTILAAANRLQWHWTIRSGLFVLWFLFLPNAPYILTDIMHLTRASQAPVWYDLALLLSCAGTGLLVGYLSLMDVQGMVARRFSPLIGWVFALTSLILSGFAIYLGRFLRWNSWDVLIAPTRLVTLAEGLIHPFSNTRLLSVTFVFGIILALGYVSLRTLLVQPGGRTEQH